MGGAEWGLAAIALASSSLFVLLVHQLPVSILAAAGYDDAWFWLRAEHIAAGHWLGPFDQLTLIKGPGYPLFLAANHLLGLPATTMQAVLYAAACLLLGAAVHRVCGRPRLVLLLVLALQWHPAALSWDRVIRDNIGAAQILLVLACLLFFLAGPDGGRQAAGGRPEEGANHHPSHRGAHGRWVGRWAWAIAAGLVLGWMWTTREDGVWVLPGLALLLLGYPFVTRASHRARPAPGPRVARHEWAGFTIGIACFLLASVGWVSLVAAVNQAKYGVSTSVDTRASAFRDALLELHRVRAGEPVPMVPVPRAVRREVYAQSPAFARLREHIERDAAKCPPAGAGCDDYGGGHFLWEMRAAASSIGAYRSAHEAELFFAQLAHEVRVACDDGRLDCVDALVDSVPPMTASQWTGVPPRLWKALRMLAWQGIGDGQAPSDTEAARVRDMWDFVGQPRVRDPAHALGTAVSGWFHGAGAGWVEVRCGPSGARLPIPRRPSPDLARHFADADAAMSRFSVRVPTVEDCVFFSTTGAGEVHLPLGPDGAPATAALGAGTLYVDSVFAGIPHEAQADPRARAFRHLLNLLYDAILPWLTVAGLLAFAWATGVAVRRRRMAPVHLVAAAAWCLVASRVALLVLVDLSSFPAIRVDYMQPAFPLLVLAAVLSLASSTPLRNQLPET